ncbi:MULTISPECIES: nucleoside triphosphate pyrophosphohydrolase [unclassified Thioalkalivibrio]|uniref:nucleoside triphosphate pyrophosphohydrolase n=1 Tax=unclassified Thioalkalivibrio TaxID=2621013 RepID=UPI00035F0705|nr:MULTISPECIES: nucleoside triphosphate pyrophosphohydrolase [unclassified Thioalkalivibrio]
MFIRWAVFTACRTPYTPAMTDHTPADAPGSLASPNPLERLRAIMARLRDPGAGCAWDRAQTAGSIVPFTLEEAYELADVVARDQGADADTRELRDELGDLLFQVVFQARIAEEAGRFDLDDVARAIGDKLVRRHPHVFADVEHGSDAEREAAWEADKARERAARAQTSAMDDIPLALPALSRAVKSQRRAARLGFDWDDPAPVVAKIHEELAEVQAAVDQGEPPARIAEEVGDVLFAVSNWARHLGVDPEGALRGSTRKFEARFRQMEALAAASGETLAGLDFDRQETLYQEARRLECATRDTFDTKDPT